jgi:hypothetical protein
MKTLSKQISSISFFEREKVNGVYVSNKCGRDFLYYALNYYCPDVYAVGVCDPVDIDRNRVFGWPVPSMLAWTQIQFFKVPALLRQYSLSLCINDIAITSFVVFFYAILFSRKEYPDAIADIEKCIDREVVCGIDISLGKAGLLDHVMFVYGYDEDNLYVCDTHHVARLEYERIDASVFFFTLPKHIIQKRWTKFGRVWTVCVGK